MTMRTFSLGLLLSTLVDAGPAAPMSTGRTVGERLRKGLGGVEQPLSLRQQG